jgi:hypothetical protein
MTSLQKLLFLMSIAPFHPIVTHHVVFEEIGEMAGTLSYVHAVVPINISGLAHAVSNFKEDVRNLEALYNKKRQPTGFSQDSWFNQRILDLFALASADADALLNNINSLRETLPTVTADTHLPYEDHEYRIQRRSPFTIIGGVIGTLMGWFTQRRLNNLRDLLEEVKDQQHRLLHAQTVQVQRIEDIESAIKHLYQSLKTGHLAWINYSSLDYARGQLRTNLQKLIRALQAAHHRRLSIDLLPSGTLKKLFDAAAQKARSHHHQLLLRHPSHLLQIETSYLHDGHDVHLILHIPMAPSDSLLRLFQLRPFPLPFTETHMLMPIPDHQILAISANTDRLSIELSAVHLLGCHRVNQVYMCERSGVLKRHLNDTCLGSLYMQDLQGATTLCEMNIVPIAETVLQLQDNWYLVHSPQPLTSRIDCLNNSASEIFIRHGANRIHVSPSCRLHLASHVLISNFAVQLDTIIKHYEWELGRISFSTEEQAHSDEWLAAFEETSIRATLTQICHSLAVEKRSSIWKYIFSLLGLVIFPTIAVILGYVFFTRYYLTLRQRVTQWVLHLLPESVRALMPSLALPEANA